MKRMNLQSFTEYISRYEDKTAYKYLDDGEIKEKTYRQLTDESRSTASWFAKNNIHKTHIAVLGSASCDWISTYLGITMSGNVAVPLDKMLPTEEICNLINMGDVQMLFASPEFKANFEEYQKNAPELKT